MGMLIVLAFGAATSGRASQAPEYEAYVVQHGQTLAALAREYGVPAEYLAQFNDLTPDCSLRPGQMLMIPLAAQLAPQFPGGMDASNATMPADDQIHGFLGTIVAERVEIHDSPDGGKVLFRNATRGSEMFVIGQSDHHYAVLMSDGSIGWLPKSALALSQRRLSVARPATRESRDEHHGDQAVVDIALKYLGIPYKYGGTLPANVDCSLLVQTVFSQCGRNLPRTAAQQFRVGTPVDREELLPGDRVYFTDRSGKIGHTGIYMGDDRFVHASSNRGEVAVDSLSDPTYARKYAGARR